MRIILFIVFYIATYVARIAIASDISRTMSGRSMRYFRQKSETARSGVSEMPVDDGIIRMINKRNKQSLLGNRINAAFPQTRRNYNLERVKRSLRKRKKRCAKNSDCKITRRRSNYADDDDVEQNISSNVASFPIWRVPESTVSAINFESTTILEAEMNNRSLLTLERPPSQLENLNYDRAVNEAVFPIAERYPSSRGLFDVNVSDKNSMLSKIANPKSEIKVNVQSPAFEGLNNKVPLPAYRPGIRANIASPNSSYPQGFQRQYSLHRRNSANEYNVKEELFNDRLASSNKRFLLVPVSKNLYVLKDIQENSRTGLDGINAPKRYKLLEGDKDNATSAILSFKAHMHHDAKDVGRAYLQRGNHRLLDHNKYLYSTLDPRVPEEIANPTENPASYPNFLYPGISFQTRSNLIDATPEISDEQIVSPIPDYANVSVDVNLRGGIGSYDSAGFLSSSSTDIPNYDVISRESANDGQLSVLSATKLDNEISLFQQDGGNYENPLRYSEFGIELTTTDFRDTFDDNVYTPATFEMYLTNNKDIFDVSQNLGDDSKFSTGKNEDESVTDFTDNISTQYRSANEDNIFFPNITYTFADNAEDFLKGEDVNKDSQEYGISIPDEYDNKKSIYSNNFDYDNRSIDEALLSNTTDMDLFLNTGDYVTAASLFPSIDEWPLKKAQSNVENSRALLMAIKPLSSELQKLLSAVKLVNRSLSDVQSRLCDKKNVVRTERKSENGKAANIAKLANKVDDSDLFTESFNSQSPEKRRIKIKNGSIAERDIKIGRKTNDIFLNKLTTLFHKRKSSISNSEVQSHRNVLEKRKLNDRVFPKSGERRRLPHSRFNRNLKSLTKNYGMYGVKPIRQLIEAELKSTKRTTTSIIRPSRLIKSIVSSENNFASGYARNHQGNNQISSSIILPSNIQDQQRNVKRAMSREISRSDKEKKITDPQFFKEATAYLDILQLLGKTQKPHIEYATDVWTTQSLTEPLPPLIFTTTEFSVSALTFLPYFTEESTLRTTLSTIAEKKEAPEMTISSLHKYVTDFGDYLKRNYTRYKDYEEITSEFLEIISLTESPVTWSTFTITLSTTLPLFYTEELTILPIDEAAILTTEKMTIISPFVITTEITETPIIIPMIENFTTESVMILTPFLEGITNITLKIEIPAATEASFKETPALIKVETVTEEETMESTSTSEIMRSLPVETDTFLYTFSTVSLFKTVETESTIKITSPTVVPTTLTITKGFQTVTTESTFGKPSYSTTAIASSPTVLERTETTLSTSTKIVITTLTLEDESPVTQIEKTITAEETATEIPTTIETETPTEITLSTTKILITVTAISTSIETTIITEISTINKTLITAKTPTSIETPTTSERPTSTEMITIMETVTPTEFLTTLTTLITKGITSAKTLTPTEPSIETEITTETSTTTEISTSTKTTIITEISTINKTLITAKTPTSIETPTASERPTSTEMITITEIVTPTEFLTTLTTLVTKGITSAKTLTPTETSIETEITTETSTTTEISTSTKTTIITEISTINKTLITAKTPTSIETPTTSERPTSTEMITITETVTPTEFLTTLTTLVTKGITSAKTLTPTETSIETEITTETSTTTEIATSTETTIITEISTINKTLITAKTPTSIETPTTSERPTSTEMITITETVTPTEFLTTLTTLVTKGITSAKTLTPTETSIETEITTEISTTTEIATSTETTIITEISTINKTLITAKTPTSIETPTTSERPTSTEMITIMETITPTEFLTTLTTLVTKGITSAKTLTPTETSIETEITTETSTTTEISTSTETTIITEISTINKTLITVKTPTSIETPTTSEKPTSTEMITIMETVTPTEFLTTLTTLVTKGITSAKTLTPTKTTIETEITTETSTTTEISTSTETTTLTEILTITETLTTTGISAFAETSTTSEIPTTSTIITETTGITETSTLTEIITTIKKPTTKKTTSTEALTPTVLETLSTTEIQMITETPTFTEILETTEITVISTTHITTELITTSESTTSSVPTTASKEGFSTSVLTTFPTTFTTETATESTLISSITPVTTTSGKITVSTLKLTTLLETLITNMTVSETAYTTISSTLTTTEGSVITSFETEMSTTSLKVATTMPLSPFTSTTLSETPSTTLSKILTQETTASLILTTSSLEMLQTTTMLPISTMESTETFLTTSSIATYTTENATVSSTTASIIITEIFESTSPVTYFTITTPSITKIPITTPVTISTGTTAYETTSASVLLTETTEGMTSPTREETKEYEEYYESTKKEIATVTSRTELTIEEYTTWITEVTITRETTTTYLPSFTTPSFIGLTTEATPLAIATITLSTITEETLSTEKIVTVTPVTIIEGISTLSTQVTLISTETSTTSAIETSSLVPTIAATTTSLLEETVTEVTETSWIITLLPTTERPEYTTILEATVAVTLAPFSESILSILITLETPATTPEVISVLPKTISEEFTISITESPSVAYITESSIISFIETTVYPEISISTAITEETLEAETEYYIAKEEEFPSYEEEYEEYEEYDTEIPTGKWYYYDEYETTTKERTTATVKHTKLPKEKPKTPPFVTGTTTLYEIETSEFTRYSTPSEITSTVTYTAGIFYTEEEVTSALETSASITENVTTIEARTEFTMSTASEKTESTTWLSFGSTEEYTLPSSTTFRIPTEPLEYLTITPKYTGVERFTPIWRNITLPKFTTKPKKIPEIVLEKTTGSEGVSAETEIAEKLTSLFVSPALTTLTEKEVFEVHTTTMSTASFETEGIIKTGYKLTTLAMTEEKTIFTPFITSEAELIFTTTSKTVGRDEQKEQLLRQLDDLKKHEKELAEKEEKLKEQEKQWDIEKEKRKKMLHEKEEAKNITMTGPTEGYVTTTEIELTSPALETFVTTSSLIEITTIPTEITLVSIAEEITFITYTTEIYVTEEAEETVKFYTTEESTFITYFTEEIEEVQITDYVTLTPYITTSIMDLYSIGLTPVETVTPYTVEEMYTTSYVTLFSEPLFAPPTITSPITSTTEKFITLPIITFSETFEEASIALITTPTWYTTEEIYTATYTDIYKPLFTLSTLEFTSTTTSPTLAIITATEIKYDEEIERLKEKLRKKERELEEREKILLEREKRLEKDIMKFEKYIEEFKKKLTSVTSFKKSTMLTSLSTPVPPTEKTIIKVQLTTQKITEKKENQTTTEMKDIQEKKPTTYVPEESVTQKEEEIVTKQICLNVLENTTIPLDKRRRDIVTKKICLPYFPEKNEQKRSVGRLSRRPLALQSTRKIKRPRWNVPSDIRCRRRVKETTRKINNLQLSHHEWLSNETTKPLRHFKGFTRIYGKMRKFPKKVAAITDMRENTTSYFQDKTSLHEYVLDHYENIFQPTATSMLNSKDYRKRNTFFKYDLISRKSNFSIDDKANVQKRDVSTIDNDARFWSRKRTANTSSQKTTAAIIEEDGFFTVNVLHLNYNEDNETHEVVSAKPDEDELTAILSESNDENYVTDFGEDRKIITPYYEIEEEDNLKEDELADKTEKKMEDEDYIEDMIDNYMNYEEHETSTWIHNARLLSDKGKNKRMTENERKLLNQAWPTEKNTIYHLGGTQFWELDIVTEPSAVLHTTIDKSKTINVSITKTTCFDVILKNERNSEVKSNISYDKRNVHRKNVSIEQRNANLRNVTRKNASRYKLRTKQPRVTATKLKQKLHGSNYSKRNYEGRRTARFNDFRRTGNEDSITGKSRKLYGVNASKLKREIIKRKDATDKHKKKQAAKSQTLRNINSHSLHNTDNCVANKKNKCKKMTTASPQMKKTHDKKSHEKVTHLNIIDHKHKSTSASHERKIHNCLDCICDIANVVNNIKSLLDRMSFPLDEIKALNCSEYKEIQDKIVISMDSDVEEAREFPQPHYNVESLKGQKYIKLEELEENFKNDLELDGDHDVVSLPGLNLNLPCNQDGDGITWLSSASRPSYTWKRTDGVALFGFVAENGDLELRNVNAKDTGNYTCVVTYMSPDNEEPVEATYEIHLQVVTLPRYVVHGEGRYHVRLCDERDLDILVTYLPLKLNSAICETDICNAYVLAPSCSQNQITVNILLVPSHIVKLMTIDSKHCNVFCLKAIQDKLSLVLSKNLQIFLGKIIIFRLPHYEQRLVPIAEESSFTRRKRGKTDANASVGRAGNVGVFSSCPAGYGLRDARCVPCNMGTYSEDGISHCKRCPPGTYQPDHGARVCRTCTNPMTKGCYNMLWNSFSAVMVTLASVGVMVLICLLLLWITCCAKKKFCVKRIAGIVAKEDAFEPEKRMEEQPLIRDASENEDQQWDSEYKIKRKKGKFYVNKKRRKQNERRKYDKMHAREDEWESHRIKNAPIIYPDSYQSHDDYNNYYPKQSYRKGPRLPECDFDT